MIVRLARLFSAQEILQRRRPDQAADMRGENTIAAALHYQSSLNPELGSRTDTAPSELRNGWKSGGEWAKSHLA
jgi:hypothetical protein